MPRAAHALWIGLLLAWPAPAVAAPPPGDGPEFEAAIPSVTYQVQREFFVPAGYPPMGERAGSVVRPRLTVRPLRGEPILNSEPRVRLTRLTIDGGAEVPAGGARIRYDRSLGAGRARFLFPAAPGIPTSASYDRVLTPWRLMIPMARLPSRIAAMEGEAIVRVVEEDRTRELVVGPERMDQEIAPGVRLAFDPLGGKSGKGELSYTSDPAWANGPRPVLNAVIVENGTGGSLVRFAVDEAGIGRTSFERAGARGIPVRTHVVSATREVRVPFRAENVVITGREGAWTRSGVWPQSVEVVSGTGEHEVRLLRLVASGTSAVEDRSVRTERQLWLAMSIKNLTGRGGRASFVRCRVDEMTDEAGRPVARLEEQKPDQISSGSAAARFLPEFAVARWGGADRTLGTPRAIGVRMPLETLPARLGRVSGRVEFLETVREMEREVELKPTNGAEEVTPGVRVIVRDPMVRSGTRTVPREDWVEVVVDLPPGVPRDPGPGTGVGGGWGPSVPRVDAVEFIDGEGKTLDGPAALTTRTDARTARYVVLREESVEKAVKVRVRVVREVRERAVPFVLEDVPCGAE
jgi:hypothetical protein